jgi:hypothetical protein
MKRTPKPRRHPDSASGDFYAVYGACASCGVPEVVAPDLIGGSIGGKHCFWKKQPESPEELARAIEVLRTQDLDCHRYGGKNPEILKCLPQENCDYPLQPMEANVQRDDESGRSIPGAVKRKASFFSRLWKRRHWA